MRPCPDGIVAEVWEAFVEWTKPGTPEQTHQRWLAYLTVHAKYYDKEGKRLDTQTNG
ncbi:hypothetical protein [Spirosoma fluminis]